MNWFKEYGKKSFKQQLFNWQTGTFEPSPAEKANLMTQASGVNNLNNQVPSLNIQATNASDPKSEFWELNDKLGASLSNQTESTQPLQKVYNRADVRSYLRSQGIEPYFWKGSLRKLLRLLFNTGGMDRFNSYLLTIYGEDVDKLSSDSKNNLLQTFLTNPNALYTAASQKATDNSGLNQLNNPSIELTNLLITRPSLDTNEIETNGLDDSGFNNFMLQALVNLNQTSTPVMQTSTSNVTKPLASKVKEQKDASVKHWSDGLKFLEGGTRAKGNTIFKDGKYYTSNGLVWANGKRYGNYNLKTGVVTQLPVKKKPSAPKRDYDITEDTTSTLRYNTTLKNLFRGTNTWNVGYTSNGNKYYVNTHDPSMHYFDNGTMFENNNGKWELLPYRWKKALTSSN